MQNASLRFAWILGNKIAYRLGQSPWQAKHQDLEGPIQPVAHSVAAITRTA